MSLLLRCLTLVLLISSFCAGAEVAVPALQARVTDLTGTLAVTEKAHIENLLQALEQEKGSQVAVLMVPTTQPETIEQYSIRVVDQWKLGRKGVDDGVLLLIAKEDRTVRIEVGYGLEGVIPDAIANRVTDEVIVPEFKNGHYFNGIALAVQDLAALIRGEKLPEPDISSDNESWMPLLIIAVTVAGSILRMIFGRMMGGFIAAGSAGVVAMFLGGFFIGIFTGLIVFVLVISDSKGRSGGGFGGGSSSGGGGFSGGGGGFGGGGASGRW